MSRAPSAAPSENKKGLVELADGGTAFFDEIGDLPLEMQVKLLRLMQEREFRAVGSLQWRKVDLRIIAATHRDLKAEVAAGRFRQDLYYRLNVFAIHLPSLAPAQGGYSAAGGPLSERRPALPACGFEPSQELFDAFDAYDWPGNVRELKHCIERMAALHSEGALQMADLPSALQYHRAASGAGPAVRRRRARNASPDCLPDFAMAPKSPVISLPESEKPHHRARRWRPPAASAARRRACLASAAPRSIGR